MSITVKKTKLQFTIAITVIITLLCTALIPEYSFASKKSDAIKAIKVPDKINAEYVAYVPHGAKAASKKAISDSDSEKLVSTSKGTVYQLDASKNELSKIKKDSSVIVEKNLTFSASDTQLGGESLWATESQLEDMQPEEPYWNLDMVDSDESNTPNDQNDIVKVAVMDSGVEWLSDVNLKGDVNMVTEEQDVPFYMCDMTGHGTSVASIINKINPDAEIYSVRVLDMNNETTLERVIRGIYWCIENDINVINLSFGASQYSEILDYVIAEAESNGITLVAAAGNGGDDGVDYPAAYDDVIAVGAVDNHGEKTDFSAEGDDIDVVAPGVDVQVQSMLGMYTWVDGTSVSAPHVAAEASLVLQRDSSKTSDFVTGLIKETAKSLDNDDCGSGIIDISQAQDCYEEYEENYTANEGDILEQNDEPVAEFTDEEVSYEGKWAIQNHFADLIGNAGDAIYNGQVTTTAMRAIKRGAGYNDLQKVSANSSEKVFKGCWHGQYRLRNSGNGTGYHLINYISAYRMIRKVANLGGDISSLSSTNPYGWITNNTYTSIRNQFVNNKIGGRSWAAAIDQKPTGTYDANTQNIVNTIYQNPQIYSGTEAHKKSLRKCFLYGMALHHVADAYSHSTFVYKQFNSMIVHSGFNSSQEHIESGETTYFANEYAHDLTFKPNRFKDAKYAAQRVVLACAGNSIGIAETYKPDFSITTGGRGYYLGRVWTYAKEVNGTISNPQDDPSFSSYFSTFHYMAPVGE